MDGKSRIMAIAVIGAVADGAFPAVAGPHNVRLVVVRHRFVLLLNGAYF